MANLWRKWCPNGCGLQVVFHTGKRGGYVCMSCKEKFARETVVEANPGSRFGWEVKKDG